MSPRRCERGAATVLVLPLLGVLTVTTVLLAFVGGALVSVRRAQSAADLAALAGAAAASRGEDACGAATRVAGRNGLALEVCAVDGPDVRVEVATETPRLLGRSVVVRARARAGPEASVPSIGW